MSGLGDIIFGKSPSVQQTSASNLSPAQQATQGQLGSVLDSLLGGTNFSPIGTQFPGNLTVNTTPQENDLLSLIEGAVGPTSQGGQTVSNAESALNSLMSGSPIDMTQYFNNVVATPLENTFEQRTLPSIKAAFARSAGGDYSPAAGQAAGFAAQDMQTQLQSALTNLTTQSLFNNQATKLSAAQSAPSLAQANVNPLLQALQALTLPTTLQQQNIQNMTGAYNSNVQALLDLLGTSTGFANQGTVANNTVVNPGNPGLLAYFMQGLGGAAGRAI